MNPHLTRRQLLKLLTAAGFGAPFATRVIADEADKNAKRGVVPENIVEPVNARDRYPARFVGGKVIQPERPLAVMHETDVLVVGGGPAGFTAAVAAARKTGARTALVDQDLVILNPLTLKSTIDDLISNAGKQSRNK